MAQGPKHLLYLRHTIMFPYPTLSDFYKTAKSRFKKIFMLGIKISQVCVVLVCKQYENDRISRVAGGNIR